MQPVASYQDSTGVGEDGNSSRLVTREKLSPERVVVTRMKTVSTALLLVLLCSYAQPSELLPLLPTFLVVRGPSSLRREKMDNARKPISQMSPSSWI